MLAVQNEGQWNRLCRNVLGRPALAEDPRFATNELRVHAREALEPLIEEALMPLERRVAEHRLADGDVPFAARSTVADLVAHPQLEARARWVEVAIPGGNARARPQRARGGPSTVALPSRWSSAVHHAPHDRRSAAASGPAHIELDADVLRQ